MGITVKPKHLGRVTDLGRDGYKLTVHTHTGINSFGPMSADGLVQTLQNFFGGPDNVTIGPFKNGVSILTKPEVAR